VVAAEAEGVAVVHVSGSALPVCGGVSLPVAEAVGRALAREPRAVLTTGGFAGVGECAGRAMHYALGSGGDGTDKQLVFLEPCTVALLAGRRDEGAAGIAGGASGAPGLDLRQQGEAWEPAPPQWRAAAGDRLRIQTPGGGGWGSSARQHPSPDTETR
jgi:hypothetical protein